MPGTDEVREGGQVLRLVGGGLIRVDEEDGAGRRGGV